MSAYIIHSEEFEKKRMKQSAFYGEVGSSSTSINSCVFCLAMTFWSLEALERKKLELDRFNPIVQVQPQCNHSTQSS